MAVLEELGPSCQSKDEIPSRVEIYSPQSVNWRSLWPFAHRKQGGELPNNALCNGCLDEGHNA